jgi:hypothetical protein
MNIFKNIPSFSLHIKAIDIAQKLIVNTITNIDNFKNNSKKSLTIVLPSLLIKTKPAIL